MVRFGADIPGVLVAVEAIALARGPLGVIQRHAEVFGRCLLYDALIPQAKMLGQQLVFKLMGKGDDYDPTR